MAFKIVVADTTKAHVFDLKAPRSPLRKIETLQNALTGKHERDIGADQPGRSRNSTTGRGTALQGKTTLKQHATEVFAKTLAKQVATLARSTDVEGVVLIMAPKLMALVKESLPQPATRKVVGTLARDLVDLPRLELQQRVNKIVR